LFVKEIIYLKKKKKTQTNTSKQEKTQQTQKTPKKSSFGHQGWGGKMQLSVLRECTAQVKITMPFALIAVLLDKFVKLLPQWKIAPRADIVQLVP